MQIDVLATTHAGETKSELLQQSLKIAEGYYTLALLTASNVRSGFAILISRRDGEPDNKSTFATSTARAVDKSWEDRANYCFN